jgi:hypothetical protein
MIVMSFITPKVAARHELLVSKPATRGEFVEHLSQASCANQDVTKFMVLLIAPKAVAMHEFLFYIRDTRREFVQHQS